MIEDICQDSKVLKEAREEHIACLKDTYEIINMILRSPRDTPPEFQVQMGVIPDEFFQPQKNIFSTLFQSVYQLLGVDKNRRILYGTLNHLFRIWVTSADNLLDNEDKIVVPIKIAGQSRVMRQVLSIMVADRVMKHILEEAVARKIITPADSVVLSDKSLQILLPSAAEEASEEGGIIQRPDPEYVLHVIHRLKTGLLFHIPFLGPEAIETNVDKRVLDGCKDGLGKFGLGCQLLDDIRDIAKDYIEKRHNYVLSKIYWDNHVKYAECIENLGKDLDIQSNIFHHFPDVVFPTARVAVNFLQEGLSALDAYGLGVGEQAAKKMALFMLKILGVGELEKCVSVKKVPA